MNVGEALGSISQPRVSIPEWEMDFQPGYELNSDLCIVSSYKYIEIRKSDLVAQFLYAICWTKPWEGWTVGRILEPSKVPILQ